VENGSQVDIQNVSVRSRVSRRGKSQHSGFNVKQPVQGSQNRIVNVMIDDAFSSSVSMSSNNETDKYETLEEEEK